MKIHFLLSRGLLLGRDKTKSRSNYTRRNIICYGARDYSLEPRVFYKQGMINKSPTESEVTMIVVTRPGGGQGVCMTQKDFYIDELLLSLFLKAKSVKKLVFLN